MLPTGDKVEMELHLNLFTGRQQYRCILPNKPCHRSAAISVHCTKQTLSPVGSNIGALYQTNLVTGRQQYRCIVPNKPCHRSAAISVHCTKSCIYSQKVLLKMGEFVARNMYSWFEKINKRNLLHLVGCWRRYLVSLFPLLRYVQVTHSSCNEIWWNSIWNTDSVPSNSNQWLRLIATLVKPSTLMETQKSVHKQWAQHE